MGSLSDKIVIFDQKLKKHGAFEWQRTIDEWAEKGVFKRLT